MGYLKLDAPVVLISGKAASGKDTVAKLLKAHIFRDAEIVPFAGLLKSVAADLWALDREKLMHDYDYKAEARGKLVKLGTKVREIVPTTWVDAVVRKVREARQDHVVIVPDCRYANELQTMRAQVFEVYALRIGADVDTRERRMGGRPRWLEYQRDAAGDASECELDDTEKHELYEINNSASSVPLSVSLSNWARENVHPRLLQEWISMGVTAKSPHREWAGGVWNWA